MPHSGLGGFGGDNELLQELSAGLLAKASGEEKKQLDGFLLLVDEEAAVQEDAD